MLDAITNPARPLAIDLPGRRPLLLTAQQLADAYLKLDEMKAAVAEVAGWLEERAAHYRALGSHDVATGLQARAERLRIALDAQGD